MSEQGFTHLHVHSQYSLLDGAIRLNELVPAVKELGMDAVAVTDHGNMFGAIAFYKIAKRLGVKPILGCEAYLAGPKGRHDRTERSSAHLVLLAKDNEGYKNLTYLVSMGFLEGFYYHPRIDTELLRNHSQGLIGTSACLGGVVAKALLREGKEAAVQAARELKELFAPGDFYLELQSNGYREQEQVNEVLIDIASTYDIPLVATADAHYLRSNDAAAHEILMCIGQKAKSLEEFRAGFEHSSDLYIKSPEEMHRAFAALCPQALENTVRISRACNVELSLSETYLPRYEVPAGQTLESFLEEVATRGLQERIRTAGYCVDERVYQERLAYELEVINKMGFPGYFLIVWDFIRHAKNNGVPVGPGRGSGAGSLVAWCLQITELDPIVHGLIFERFLNPERVSMPDFDIDFCQDRRGEVIEYVADKYGRNNVAQIVTYSELSAKSVIKDVARVMGIPFAEVNELTKLIPNLEGGKKVSIDRALEIEPKLREIQKDKPIYAEVMGIARSLEGLNRQTGMHAAGIVIADKPLWDYVPVCKGKDGEIVTQFAKDEVEEAGLVKFDFLGLKTLTVIAKAVEHVRKRTDEGPLGGNAAFDIERIPLDDARVYALISSADTDGVFQLESSGFKELLRRLKPDRFEDIVAAVALYRPGPLDAGMVDDYIARKHGRKAVTYPHEACSSILEPTYGVIVYQEQVMRIAVTLCGFSMGEADTLRKAMGKKKADVMAKMQQRFVQGALDTSNMPERDAGELFNQIEKFAGYAFNKSHSAAYAAISYQTAYLKFYYPVEFMAALLSTEMRTQDNVVKYIQSSRERGIRILPPEVNRSERDFSVVRDNEGRASILFGLGAVKGLGDAAIETIVSTRQESLFASLYDFCERVELRRINRRALEALIKSGAFDALGRPRWQIFGALDKALEAAQSVQKDRAVGQGSLFGGPENKGALGATTASPRNEHYPDRGDGVAWTERFKLRGEKEALGFYITGHPLDRAAGDLRRLGVTTTAELVGLAERASGRTQEVAVAGVVSALRERPLRSGNGRMAFLTLEDLQGACEVLVFSKVFSECEPLLKSEESLLIRGTAVIEGEEEGTSVKVRAASVELLAEVRAKATQRCEITVSVEAVDEGKLTQLKEILEQHPGKVPTRLRLCQPRVCETVIALPESSKIDPNDELLARLDDLFGTPVVRLS